MERESGEGWGVHGEARSRWRGDLIRHTGTLRPHGRRTLFFEARRLKRVHLVCQHAAPSNHWHHDREHLPHSRLLDLHPGWCLLQVAVGARGQTPKGGDPGLRESQAGPSQHGLTQPLAVFSLCVELVFDSSSASSVFLWTLSPSEPCYHFYPPERILHLSDEDDFFQVISWIC